MNDFAAVFVLGGQHDFARFFDDLLQDLAEDHVDARPTGSAEDHADLPTDKGNDKTTGREAE